MVAGLTLSVLVLFPPPQLSLKPDLKLMQQLSFLCLLFPASFIGGEFPIQSESHQLSLMLQIASKLAFSGLFNAGL